MTHVDHLRLCWRCIEDAGVLRALDDVATRLRGMATQAGVPRKYHHTVTWAFVLLVAERRIAGESFEAFLVRNPDLLDGHALLGRYWTPGALEAGRGAWVGPDRDVTPWGDPPRSTPPSPRRR